MIEGCGTKMKVVNKFCTRVAMGASLVGDRLIDAHSDEAPSRRIQRLCSSRTDPAIVITRVGVKYGGKDSMRLRVRSLGL